MTLVVRCKDCNSPMDFPRKADGGYVFGATELVCTNQKCDRND